MAREARFLARILPVNLTGPLLDTLCRELAGELELRITVVGSDGKVLGDSAEPSVSMENHLGRPEVTDAVRHGSGSATRYSTTVGHDMVYHAFYQPISESWRVIRVAKPLADVERAIQALRWSLLSGLLAASILGLLLAWLFSRRLTRRFQHLAGFAERVAQGSFPRDFFPSSAPDEIALLEQQLNDMSLKIQDNLRQVVAEKEKADSILRCMVEGVVVLDPKGDVMLMNERAKSMFGVPAGENKRGVSMLEISRHPEMRKLLTELHRLELAHQPYGKELELDGDRWFRLNAVKLRDSLGQLLGSILVFHDVTEVKRFESMRSDFVANVSHELRTPLTAIRGYVETLLQAPPHNPQDSRQFLEIIDRHSERLSRLTEDLLILSDLESGKIQLAIQPVEIAQLIQPALPKVSGDADRLQQLLINLIDNAIKYTPAGGEVTIQATRLVRPDQPSRVEVAVSDTGAGIPEHDLPRLTERFYRVDKARSRELGGTGLGLAIVKHIVQAHKGELKIESAVGKGTTVRVRLSEALAANGASTTAPLEREVLPEKTR
jgi:two-component system phosphate regulon sensor histidine kinase PhoR